MVQFAKHLEGVLEVNLHNTGMDYVIKKIGGIILDKRIKVKLIYHYWVNSKEIGVYS